MGKLEKQPHGGALLRPSPGETANRRGRPRKFVSELREQGYKLSEMNDCIRAMLAMTEDELAAVVTDPRATILEITIAKALQRSIEKSNLNAIESLLSRAYGRPREPIEASGEITIHRLVIGANHT